jgi:Xaa-Pro aminopeptidase
MQITNEEAARREKAARTFEHKRGPPQTETFFRQRNVASGWDKDQLALSILRESIESWRGVPFSWITLDEADASIDYEHTPEHVDTLFAVRTDVMQEVSDAIATFAYLRAAKMEAERKNFAST